MTIDRPAISRAVLRGTMRLLVSLDLAPLAEMPLPSGRRADIMAIGASGAITIVEIKSSAEDYVADQKWPDYRDWADRLYFAVAPDFPLDLLPQDEGLILADAWRGEIVREGTRRPLAPARRRSLQLAFARLAALRQFQVLDPTAAL